MSTTTVDIEWSGFPDLEQEGVIPHLSGISYYEVALGEKSFRITLSKVQFTATHRKLSNVG